MAHVVRQLHDDVLHEVEHDHLEEVALLEGAGQADLVGDGAGLLALLLDDLVLAREQVLARARVEHHEDELGLADVPVEAGDVAHLDQVRVGDADALEPAELVLHLVAHGLDFLLQPGAALVDDDPALERVLLQVLQLVRHVFVDVVLVAVVSVAVVRADESAAAQLDLAVQ